MVKDLINKIGCKEKLIFNKDMDTVTVNIFKDFLVVYSSRKNEAKKYSLSKKGEILGKLVQLSNSMETIIYA